MNECILPGTGITVSKVCIGAMMFGARMNEKESIDTIKFAVDNGINFIDTANVYAQGRSEEFVGKAIKLTRDKIVLASKVGYEIIANSHPNESGLSRRHIMKAINDSLRRLDTDYIDIYYMHRPIYNMPVEETLDTMTTLVRSGKIRYIGVSNQAAWQICECIWNSRCNKGVAPVVSEVLYNMLTRNIENEFVPFAKEYKIGIVIYNPIGGGLLSGKHKFDNIVANTRFDGNKQYSDRYWYKENFEAIDKFTKIAEKNGMTLVELALRWCCSQPHVDAVIMGMSSLNQFKGNLGLYNKGPLSEAILRECDEVWFKLAGNPLMGKYNRGVSD
jgi:aryl-alcohol dehydrogenase (NADP+)